MSVRSSEFAYPRASAERLIRAITAQPLPLRAFVGSRLLVLAAGVVGGLSVARRDNWSGFDPSHLSAHLGAVGNVVAGVAVRWDSIHYLSIASHGYTAAGSTVFLPLYPLLIRTLSYPLDSAPAAGVVISVGSLLVALVLLHRLSRLELGRRAADASVLLVAFAPLSFFFSAVYTESLFLALSLGSVYAARRSRWKLAVGLAALAAITRVTGVLLLIPLLVMRLQAWRRPDRRLLLLLAVPAALAGYLAFVAVQGFGPLAPFLQQATPEYQRTTVGPVGTVISAVRAAVFGAESIGVTPVYQPSLGGPFSPGAESVLLLIVLAIALAALVVAFRRLPMAYGAYALAALLVCISSPVPEQPLRSVDRYTLTIFPLWMAAGAWIAERRLTRSVVLLSAGLLAFYAVEFASWTWVA